MNKLRGSAFELIWKERGLPEHLEVFSTLCAAERRILEIRLIALEWTLLERGTAIDWGYYER